MKYGIIITNLIFFILFQFFLKKAIINKLKKNNATKILKSQYYQKEKANLKKNLLQQQQDEMIEINNEMKKAIINTINSNIEKTLKNNNKNQNECNWQKYLNFKF